MKTSDEIAINNAGQEMYGISADHGFHNAGGGELDEEAKFLLALHGEISSHWEKLRKGISVSPLDASMLERARAKADETTTEISFVNPIRPDGEIVDVGRMARFILNLIGEASELWEATSDGTLDNRCDKQGLLYSDSVYTLEELKNHSRSV